jgi:predicted ArsR family transcriptional regulator
MKAKINGTELQRLTAEARSRVIKFARENGHVTNKEARELLGTAQAYYHLQRLQKAGLLRHAKYNQWVPVKRRKRGRPKASELRV